jgi:hypothetical protein
MVTIRPERRARICRTTARATFIVPKQVALELPPYRGIGEGLE